MYFEIKIKVEKENDKGSLKVSKEVYLVDALSFTEVEATIGKEIRDLYSDFLIETIKKTRYQEIVASTLETDDKYFKVRVDLVTFDDEKNRETRNPIYFLVEASNPENANSYIKEHLKGSISDYEIVSIIETKILDIFNY